jgi:hypothetical protein
MSGPEIYKLNGEGKPILPLRVTACNDVCPTTNGYVMIRLECSDFDNRPDAGLDLVMSPALARGIARAIGKCSPRRKGGGK